MMVTGFEMFEQPGRSERQVTLPEQSVLVAVTCDGGFSVKPLISANCADVPVQWQQD